MAKIMKKRTIIAIVALVVLVALIGCLTTWYIFVQSNKPQPVTTSPVSLDQTPEYGACEIITSDMMRNSANGDRITSIVEGVRIGQTAPNETTAEGCSFAFASDKSNQNTLTVSVYPYTATTDGSVSEIAGSTWSEVMNSSPMAYFGRGTIDDGKTTVYTLRELPGSKNVLYTLKQPTDKLTYNEADALDFLVGIATKANTDVVTENTPSEVTEGLPPEPDYAN